MKKRISLSLLIVLVGCGTLRLRAKFVRNEIENVPIDRVVKNLERQASQNPLNFQIRVNLARVHAMAYASKSETAPVRKSRNSKDPPSDTPDFGVLVNQFVNVEIRTARNEAAMQLAREHLAQAIQNYETAIAIDSSSLIARLGRAWCLAQQGDRAVALAAYRKVMELAWAQEGSGKLPRLRNFMPITEEVAGYLTPLLDPLKDAAEIREIQKRVAAVGQAMMSRPITPVAIPLGDDFQVSSLIEREKPVVFDADGTGLQKRWSWITPQAGWLVFDKLGRKKVNSALDLFGNVTFWMFWDTGYSAMSALDDNGDGELSGP